MDEEKNVTCLMSVIKGPFEFMVMNLSRTNQCDCVFFPLAIISCQVQGQSRLRVLFNQVLPRK